MAAKVWPATLWPSTVMFDIEGQSESGGKSQSGYEQPVIVSSGRIVATLSFSKLTRSRPWEILTARAIKAHMRGRANTVLIGPYEASLSPAGLLGEPLGPFDTPHDDDTLFDDDTGYDQAATPAHVATAAAAGDVQLRVVMEGGHRPLPGHWFGLKGKEVYSIAEAEDQGGNTWLLSFTPVLRRNAVVGEPADFDNPPCEMRAKDDLFGKLEFEKMFQTDFKLDLVEATP